MAKYYRTTQTPTSGVWTVGAAQGNHDVAEARGSHNAAIDTDDQVDVFSGFKPFLA